MAQCSSVKTEFAYGEEFNDFQEMEMKWFAYVNWYNNTRIHGSLGYAPHSASLSALFLASGFGSFAPNFA